MTQNTVDSSIPAPKPCNSTLYNPDQFLLSPLAKYKSFLPWSPTLTIRTNKYKILKRPLKKAWANHLQTALTVITNAAASDLTNLHPSIPPTHSLGVGFAYTEQHPFVCIDLDNLDQDNLRLATELSSFTEISPSGQGYHIIVSLSSLEEKQLLLEHFSTGKRDKAQERDLYIASGFVTITNNLVEAFPPTVRTFEAQELSHILAKYFAKNSDANQTELPPFEDPQDDTRLSVDQVKALLFKINVRNLTSDIFDRLRSNSNVLLDEACEEEAREPWLTIGQAIHHNFNGSLAGFQLWRDWSATGQKFNQEDTESVWRSFKGQNSPVTIATLIKLVKRQYAHFEHHNAKGFILPTIQNFRSLLDFLGVIPAFNVFNKQISITVPKHKQAEWNVDATSVSPSVVASLIQSEMYAANLKIEKGAFNLTQIKLYTQAVASINTINPIRDYFVKCGKQWDGHDYITPLMRTIITAPGHVKYRSSYRMFIRKWLLQVAAAACHKPDQPPRLNRVLIFQGPQNIGKTKWVESLFPPELRKYCSADKDLKLGKYKTESTKLAMELTNTLICNINEIDRLFKSSTYSEFKAFLDQTMDQVVLPYGDAPTVMTRRTVFIGSTNESQFLTDATGNRRVEIVEATMLDFAHDIPIDQLWGQIYNLYSRGEKWWLDIQSTDLEELQAIEHRDEINSSYMAFKSETLALELDDYFDASCDFSGRTWRKYTLKDIKAIIGVNMLPGGQTTKLLKDTLNTWRSQIPTAPPVESGVGPRARVYYWMPPLRDNVPSQAFQAYDEKTQSLQ